LTEARVTERELGVKCEMGWCDSINFEESLIGVDLVGDANDKELLGFFREEALESDVIEIFALSRVHFEDGLEVGARIRLFVVGNVVDLFFVIDGLGLVDVSDNFVVGVSGRDGEAMARRLEPGDWEFFVDVDLGVEDVIVELGGSEQNEEEANTIMEEGF
jgi:hypothetical protein